MRTFLFLAVVLFAMPVHAQQSHDDGQRVGEGRAAEALATTDAGAGSEGDMVPDADAGSDAGATPSGFGQVMSVLTGLLQDAAQREATGRSDGFALDNPAIRISVTPVEGRTSLLREPIGRHATATGRKGGARELAGGTPR